MLGIFLIPMTQLRIEEKGGGGKGERGEGRGRGGCGRSS